MPETIIAPSAGPSGGGGGSTDIIALVAADVVNATNSIVLTDVTGLTFSTTASATELWRVELLLATHANASAATTAKFKFGWSVSGAQTIRWGGNNETGQTAVSQPVMGTQASTLSYPSAGNILGLIRLVALVNSNGAAGAVQLRFAQQLGQAGAVLTIKADSLLIATKVRP